jgi:N utilization substance protein A
MVVSELRGEKIDIIPWNPEPARFIAKALSPARVREVFLDDEGREATVVVPDDQLALAIGKEGLNARLAARLTGWRVDIQSDTEFAQAEADAAYGGGEEGEEWTGRCSAILANGKRCPNEALEGSRYCGLPAHQALASRESELPAEAPAGTATATVQEAEELPAVARVEEPGQQSGAAGDTAGAREPAAAAADAVEPTAEAVPAAAEPEESRTGSAEADPGTPVAQAAGAEPEQTRTESAEAVTGVPIVQETAAESEERRTE